MVSQAGARTAALAAGGCGTVTAAGCHAPGPLPRPGHGWPEPVRRRGPV